MIESKPRDRERPRSEESDSEARPIGSCVRTGRGLCTASIATPPVLPREPTLADKLVASQGRYGVDVFLSLFRKQTDKRRG